MILYLDSSALVKFYVREDGDDLVADAVADAAQIWTCMVAFAEVRAGLRRRWREGALSQEAHDDALRQLTSDWGHLNKLAVDAQLAQLGGVLATEYALRGFDAIHMAAAVQTQTVAGSPSVAVFDKKLAAAMRKAGLTVLGG